MAAKVSAGEEPWKGSWDILVNNTDGFLDDVAGAQEVIYVDSDRSPSNYIRLARDCAKAYQLALRFHGSGKEVFARKAVEILNAWASIHERWDGDSNVKLRAGLYGCQFACAAELLRDYEGWSRPDFDKFRHYMRDRFHPLNADFLERHNGTVDGHYWANWDLANMSSVLAIGVLCDDRRMFEEGVKYFREGVGTGSVGNAVVHVHPNGLGQWQESGRDQGHSLMGPQLMGIVCEIAWNQGVDLYGFMDNLFLRGVEYVSKYNVGGEVPFVTYVREWGHVGMEKYEINPVVSPDGRGALRPGWDLVYHHYVNRRGLSAPFTNSYAERCRPEGGGFNYGGNSGGFDSLGFTTLTHGRDPIGKGVPPSSLRVVVEGDAVSVSWMGSADAEGYRVKRSMKKGGPYELIAEVDSSEQFHIDSGLQVGVTYFYVVSAVVPGGEAMDSCEVEATPDARLVGRVIGTDGSYGDRGADKSAAFDGSLENYFDPPGLGAWVGLDLGSMARINEVRYCPRDGFGSRMIGGRFQASNSPDFSQGVAELLTIVEEPKEGVMTSRNVGERGLFRYVRYIAPADGGWCNVAELQFTGERAER